MEKSVKIGQGIKTVPGNQSEPFMPEIIKPHTQVMGRVPSGIDAAKKQGM